MDERTIAELQAGLASGEFSSRELTTAYLSVIQQVDKQGPALNAIIELNPDALSIADALDAERRATGARGPLHGIPLILKDNIDTADRMMTTAGSIALAGSIATEDATVTARLRAAGAIVLGKANLSEWANFRSTHSTSGWSSRGGQTRNPYALDRNPCGSSSGSAVAVAANLCAAAIGTETDGSIICPSQTNGVVGIKPTVGLVSRAGIIPISHTQDTAGPIARTVADAALVLGALTGVDPHDTATHASGGRFLTDYTSSLDRDGLRGARIGIARKGFGFDSRVDAIIEEAIGVMARLGAVIVDPADVQTPDALGKAETEVLLYDFKTDLNAYLAHLGPEVAVHSLTQLIAFNEAHSDAVMPYFGQERLLLAEEKGGLDGEPYLAALETCRRLSRTEGIDATLEKHQLDAIIAPSGGPAWMTDWVNGDHYTGGDGPPAAVAGYPEVTVPAGTIFGLPVGLSFIGGAYQEPVLIRLAYAFEQATQARRQPTFLPTVDMKR